MADTDILNDLLTSDPNAPATQGVVLLLRTEMKSEFKSVRSEMGQLQTQINGMQTQISKIVSSLDLVAQQVAILVQRK